MSSAVSSSHFANLVPCHGKPASELAGERPQSEGPIDADATERRYVATSNSDDNESKHVDDCLSSPTNQMGADQPIDLTTPNPVHTGTANQIACSSTGSSPVSDSNDNTELNDELRKLQKQPTDDCNASRPHVNKDNLNRIRYDAESQSQSVRSTGSKRKSEHPMKLDYQQLLGFDPSTAKMARSEGHNADARQFIRSATSVLKEHLTTATNRLVEDAISRIEAYFCVAPQNAPFGSKVSKECQTDVSSLASIYQASLQQQQLQNLASTYNELLASAGTSGNPLISGQNRNTSSPPSLLSSVAQLSGISTLYSPVSPPQQQQAAAVAAALAATTNSRMGCSANQIAGLLPPSTFNAATGPYQGVYNPYLANVFQSAAQALLQQQPAKSTPSSTNNNAAALLLNNLNHANNSKKLQTNGCVGQASNAGGNQLNRHQSASPSPSFAAPSANGNNASSSGTAIDFSTVANLMAAAAKRKRTKVTDTRLSARTARKLLDNSFQSAGPVSDCELVNVDGATPEKLSRGESSFAECRGQHYTGQSSRDDDEVAMALVKGDIEDFENDDRLLEDEQGDHEEGGMNAIENPDDMSPAIAGSSSSRVSVSGADGDEDVEDNSSSTRHLGVMSQSALLLPFTPSRNHHLQPAMDHFPNESSSYQQNGLSLPGSFQIGKTSTLTSMHLRKAKLMFFYVRYPSSSVLKMYFPDVSFNKNNTAQLVKWFSNFREFYYINIEKYARQLVAEGVTNSEEVDVNRNSELFKVLNLHYNRNNQLQVPPGFIVAVRTTVREFMRAILLQKDQDPSWKKQIYKVISRLDEPLPGFFRSLEWMHQLLAD